MAHLEDSFDQELHGDSALSLPKNRRSLISLKKIKEHLDKGDRRLLEARFALGRENDVHPLFGLDIEELDLHVDKPYAWDLLTLYDKSKSAPTAQAISQLQAAYANDERLSELKLGSFMNSGWDNEFDSIDAEEKSKYLKQQLEHLFHLRLNASDDVYFTSIDEVSDDIVALDLFNRRSWSTDSKLRDINLLSTNSLTLLLHSYVSNDDLLMLNRNRRLADIIDLWYNKEYALIDKADKQQLYSTWSGIRPNGKMYSTWNGFQAFDLDIKNSATPDAVKNIGKIKSELHEHLSRYNWYLGITYSSSRTGLHVYTKVSKPHHLFNNQSDNEELMKFWFRMNYLHKYSVLRYHLAEDIKIDLALDKKKAVIDFAMARITQGIKVAHDDQALINEDWYDLPLMYTFNQGPDRPLSDWLMHKSVVSNKTFTAWTRLYQHVSQQDDPYEAFEQPRAIGANDVKVDFDNDSIRPYDGEPHYTLRWNVCNTLAALLGEQGRSLAHFILKSEQCRNSREIDGMFNSAVANGKEPSEWGLQVLKRCGFKIVVTAEAQEKLAERDRDSIISLIKSGADKGADTSYDWSRTLPSDKYLSDLTSELENEFEQGKVNLIVSPPGTGKTEFVKQLAKERRVLLILPYISVIDAKVVKDAELGDNFDAFTGSRSLEEIAKGRSAVMTIDKFGNLDLEKYSHLYDYIIVDESHLTFTSSYRISAMSKALRKMKELIKDTDEFSAKTKLILMTGTVTGEIAYFGFYNSLKTFRIDKETDRTKRARFVVCQNTDEQQFLVAKHIATSIQNGIKVLYPTNQGDVQAIKLVGMIEHILQRPIKWGYYKKSNWNSELNTNINDNATVSDYDLILATNYLSVGIDIKDINQFECIYDDSFKAHEIEQFNCRLRKVDISSTIYVPLKMSNGDINPKLLNTQGWTLEMDRVDRDLLRDFMDISNAKMRLAISFDPITNRIYTPGFRVENGQIVFDLEEHELIKFEERFDQTMSTPYFIARTLSSYGYEIAVETADDSEKSSVSEVLGAGLEAAKLESEILNDTMKETVTWMFDNNDYVNAHNSIINGFVSNVFSANGTKVTEDKTLNEIKVEEDFLGMPIEIKVPNARIFNESYPIAMRFMSLYCPETAFYLFNQCLSSSGKIVKAEVQRYMRLINFVRAEERGNVGPEIMNMIRNVYDMVDKNMFEDSCWMSNEQYEASIDEFTLNYLNDLNLNLRTDQMKAKYRMEVAELLNILTTKRRKNKGVELSFRILPTPDNEVRIKRNQFDSVLMQLFQISDNALPGKIKQSIRAKHLSESQLSGLRYMQSKEVEITV